MNTKNKVLFHFIICTTFLVLPFLLTPPHREEFGVKIGDYLIIRKEAANFILLLFFYINYYYLLPKLYFKKRHLPFAAWLIFIFLLCLLPDFVLNNYTTAKHNFTFFINSQITLFLFLSVYFITYSIRINLRLKEVEREISNSQLSFLKGQINPHFLFNTLNSIYALALKKSDDTADAIVKLSGMMRYSISEVENKHVLLEKEIQFLVNYVALQKIRLGATCNIQSHIENDNPNDKIIPLVFIAFVENAFKYGVAPEKNPTITIILRNHNGNLSFIISNQKLNKTPEENSTEIGISNTKKRLDLLYPNKYTLEIEDLESNFTVKLNINLR